MIKGDVILTPPEAPGAHVEPEAEPNERHSRRGKMKRSKNLIYFD